MGISPSLDINLGVSTNRYFTAEINRAKSYIRGIRKPQELAEPAPPPDPLLFSRGRRRGGETSLW